MKKAWVSVMVLGCLFSSLACTTVVKDDALGLRVNDLDKRVNELEKQVAALQAKSATK